MSKLFSAFAVIWVFGQLFSAILENGSGFAVTTLNSSLTSAATSFSVASTADFVAVDILWIDDERLACNVGSATTFTGCARGQQDPDTGMGGTPAAHSAQARVRNDGANVLNQMMNFNYAAAQSTVGTFFAFLGAAGHFILVLPNLFLWNYSFMTGDLVFLRYVGMAVSFGAIVTLILSFVNASMGILKP